jgi:hypothetical protein
MGCYNYNVHTATTTNFNELYKHHNHVGMAT